MPIPANYDDDTEQKPVVSKTTGAPNFNDAEAFPDAEWGSGSDNTASSVPGGKSFAALAGETLPPQKGGFDLDKPIRIKVARPAIKPRIVKVKDAYKNDKRKMSDVGFQMYHDNGIPPGVSEKKAPCEMASVGSPVSTLQEFGRCWNETLKLQSDAGANIRLFRSDFAEPSPDNDKLEKGGKYQFWVGKEIVQDTFEELCYYLLDKRLDSAIVGLCWCVRQNFDLIQLWTKTASSAKTQDGFIPKLQSLLGMKDAEVSYQRLTDAYPGKKVRAHKYYLVETMAPSTDDSVVMSVESNPLMRETPNKKEKKKGPDDFVDVSSGRETKPRKSVEKGSPVLQPADEKGATISENNYGLLLDGEEDADDSTEKGEELKLFEKKKSDKSRKNSTKKGSRSSKKGNDEDFDLPDVSKPLISQNIFVGAGLGGILLVAFLAIFMSGVLK
jgi:hypothetical protein